MLTRAGKSKKEKAEDGCCYLFTFTFCLPSGEVQEWLNWQHWKCCERETVPWVRIPPSPPENFGFRIANFEFGKPGKSFIMNARR
jgi:hypothetical protein